MSVIYTPTPPRPKSAVPKTPAERAAALLEVIAGLDGLIDLETRAIERGKARDLRDITLRKQKLSVAFDELCRLLRVDPAGLTGLDDLTKKRLKAGIVRIRERNIDHTASLRTKSEARKALVECLVRGYRQEQHEDAQYPRALGLMPAPRAGEVRSATLNVRV